MDLADVIKNYKPGEVYKATFAIDQYWYIIKSAGAFWYCDENGEAYENMSAMPLTSSNLRADYELHISKPFECPDENCPYHKMGCDCILGECIKKFKL